MAAVKQKSEIKLIVIIFLMRADSLRRVGTERRREHKSGLFLSRRVLVALLRNFFARLFLKLPGNSEGTVQTKIATQSISTSNRLWPPCPHNGKHTREFGIQNLLGRFRFALSFWMCAHCACNGNRFVPKSASLGRLSSAYMNS